MALSLSSHFPHEELDDAGEITALCKFIYLTHTKRLNCGDALSLGNKCVVDASFWAFVRSFYTDLGRLRSHTASSCLNTTSHPCSPSLLRVLRRYIPSAPHSSTFRFPIYK